MSAFAWTIAAAGPALLWVAAVPVNKRRARRYDGSGEASDGVVVFVEPLWWLIIV